MPVLKSITKLIQEATELKKDPDQIFTLALAPTTTSTTLATPTVTTPTTNIPSNGPKKPLVETKYVAFYTLMFLTIS